MQPDRLQRSGRNNPCPSCGRVKDGDCAFNSETILCHQGSDPRPTDNLRPGDTIVINGTVWALIRHNAGYSGCADLLKPHNDRSPVPMTRAERRAHDAVIGETNRLLADRKAVLFALVKKVRRHVDPIWLTLSELNAQQLEQERAWEIGIAYARAANAFGRHRPNHQREMRLIARLLREIRYQLNATRTFRITHLGELHGR